MTIFKGKLDEEYLTTSEVKGLLAEVGAERVADEERGMYHELTYAIEHVNRFARLDPKESHELAEKLAELEEVNGPTAIEIVDSPPQSRDGLHAVFARQHHALLGDEPDKILDVVAKHV